MVSSVKRRLARHPLLWLSLVPLVVLALCEASGWFFLRGPAESMLAERAQREVRISPPFRLHLLGGIRVRAGHLWMAAPEGFGVPHFVDAEKVALRLRYADLFRLRQPDQPLRLASLLAERVDVRLVRLPDRRATWHFGTEPSARPPPVIDFLQAAAGEMLVRDALTAADIKLRFFGAESDAAGEQVARVEANGELRKKPIKAEFRARGRLPLAANDAKTAPLQSEGWLEYGGVRLDFSGTATDLLGARNIRGRAIVRGPSLSVLGQLIDSPLPTTDKFDLQGDIDKEGSLWKARVTKATVGTSSLVGQFTFDHAASPPRLEGELGGKRFVLADLAPALGTRDPSGAEVSPRPGHKLPDRPLNLPVLRKMNARIAVNLDNVDLGTAFRQTIAPLRATLTLDNGKLALSDIAARTAQGKISGDIAVDSNENPPLWRANLGWEGIRLEDWLRAAKGGGGKGGAKTPRTDTRPYVTGTLHGRSKLTGRGKSTAQILASLDGETTMFVRNGTLSHLVVEAIGLDVAQALGLILRGDDAQPIQCGLVDLNAKDGVLTPRVALIDTPVTLVLADGSVNLARERLALRLTAKPKNVSPLTLRAPILVTGTFADPAVAPEAMPVAAKVLGAIGLAFLNPLAAILPFIDPGEATGSPCAKALAAFREKK